jgi:lipid-A-disaccharide synthase
MAEWAKQKGIKVVYYISPQLWAWKQNRIKKVKAYVDEMYCILPFEQEFYKSFNIDVKYFGHPLLDEIVRFNALNLPSLPFEKPILALLPGSRLQEVRRKLPIMLEAAKAFPEYQVVVACSAQIPSDFYASFNATDVSFLLGKTYEILNEAAIAFVTSGTATLETALLDVPQVVCYKSSGLSFWIAKRVVKIKYISLVNLILGKGLVTELIQQECNSKQLVEAMKKIAIDGPERDAMLQGYKELKLLLGGEGASKRIAASIHETFLR